MITVENIIKTFNLDNELNPNSIVACNHETGRFSCGIVIFKHENAIRLIKIIASALDLKDKESKEHLIINSGVFHIEGYCEVSISAQIFERFIRKIFKDDGEEKIRQALEIYTYNKYNFSQYNPLLFSNPLSTGKMIDYLEFLPLHKKPR